MGKDNKVYAENGKAAKSAVQKYWEQQRQKEKEKQKLKKKFNNEGQQEQQKSVGSSSVAAKKPDEDDIYDKKQIEMLKLEREKRKQGIYNAQINVKSVLKSQQPQEIQGITPGQNKVVNVPGFGNGFISELEILRNKKEMERKKELHKMLEQKAQQKKAEKAQKEQLAESGPQKNIDSLNRDSQEQSLNPVKKQVQVQSVQQPQTQITQQPAQQWEGVIVGESTVKKSKIDLSQDKTLFIPHHLKKTLPVDPNKVAIKNPVIKEKPQNDILMKEFENFKQSINNL